MQVIILSESAFKNSSINEDDVIISIVSPEKDHPRPTVNCLKRLDIEFHDVMWENAVSTDSIYMPAGMTDQQAMDIAMFASEWVPKAGRLIVHCEAGVSRSAGVAVGIARYLLNDEDENAIRDHSPHFNVFVASKIWKAFRELEECQSDQMGSLGKRCGVKATQV